ncbi:MAG: PEFG-CTERM sorting domain-containing protein [Nitrosopumilus sp. D6]|nr:MAG: PEFG-CTERM sorting domain-containing protein [Nitrosopumilus sp. D6]
MRIETICVILTLVLFPVAFAQESLTVETNSDTYFEGDTIVVSGSVGVRFSDETPIIIYLSNEDGTRIGVHQGPPSLDNKFAASFIAEGSKWKKSGTYNVNVFYGGAYTAKATFEFSTDQASRNTESIFEVDAGNKGTFDVKYTIRGGTLMDMRIVPKNLGMTVEIEASDDGSMTIDLPREFIGAETQDSKDIPFIVLIDGIEVDTTEAPVHSEFRTITVDFLEGDAVIDIIGTYVIPEFGAVMLVVMAGTAAMIAASRKI